MSFEGRDDLFLGLGLGWESGLRMDAGVDCVTVDL
jgi:hypothetical protein